MRQANYSIVTRECGPGRTVIRDVGPHDKYPTVTNDVENVVDRLRATGHLRERLFYYDSEGDLGEILLKDGRFFGFAPGPNRGGRHNG